jgi:hypothetical protein
MLILLFALTLFSASTFAQDEFCPTDLTLISQPQKIALGHSFKATEKLENLLKRQTSSKVQPIAYSEYDEPTNVALSRMALVAERLVAELLEPTDIISRPVDVFLYSGAKPNISIFTLDRTYVALSTGLLKQCESEDELAWAISSELERHFELVTEEKSTSDFDMAFANKTLNQASETKALRRVVKIGRSPQAAQTLPAKLRVDAPYLWEHRQQTIGIAKTALYRDGQFTDFRLGGFSPEKFNYSSVRKTLLEENQFFAKEKNRRNYLIEQQLNVEGAWKYFFAWASGTATPKELSELYDPRWGSGKTPLEKIGGQRWRQIESIANDFLSHEDEFDLQLRLNQNLLMEFQKNRKLAFPTEPHTLNSIDVLLTIQPSALFFSEKMAICRLMSEYDSKRADVRDQNAEQSVLDRAERQLTKELRFFEPNISAEEFVTRKQKLEKEERHWPWHRSLAHAEFNRALARVGLYPKHIGRLFEVTLDDRQTLEVARVPLAVETAQTSAELLDAMNGHLDKLSGEPLLETLTTAWKKITKLLETSAEDAKASGGVRYLLRAHSREQIEIDPNFKELVLSSTRAWLDSTIGMMKLEDHTHIESLINQHRHVFPEIIAGFHSKMNARLAELQSVERDRLNHAIDNAFGDSLISRAKATSYLSRTVKEVRIILSDATEKKYMNLPIAIGAVIRNLKSFFGRQNIQITDDEIKTLALLKFEALASNPATAEEKKFILTGLDALAKNHSLAKHRYFFLLSVQDLLASMLHPENPLAPSAAAEIEWKQYFDDDPADQELVQKAWADRTRETADLLIGFGNNLVRDNSNRTGGQTLNRLLLEELEKRGETAETALYHLMTAIPTSNPEKQLAILQKKYDAILKLYPDRVTANAEFFKWAYDVGFHVGDDTAVAIHLFLGKLIGFQRNHEKNTARFDLQIYDELSRGEALWRKTSLKESEYVALHHYRHFLPSILEDRVEVKKYPKSFIGRFALDCIRMKRFQNSDAIYEYLLPEVETLPEVAELFKTIEFLKGLENRAHYDALARWQMEQVPGFKAEAARLRDPRTAQYPARDTVRPVFQATYDLLKNLYPEEASIDSNGIVEFIERNLVTSEAETKLFDGVRLSRNALTQSKKIQDFSLISVASMFLKKPQERMQLIKFLVGAIDTPPDFGKLSSFISAEHLQTFKDIKYRHYPAIYRAYLLQSFIGQHGQMMNEPGIRQSLKDLILGPRANNQVASTLYDEYFSALPPDEAPLIISMVLAQYDSNKNQGGSLLMFGEASGPLGGKGIQKLVTSGILPKEERESLLGSFDDFLPPDRSEIHHELHKIFGSAINEILAVGPLAGSGSVNWAAVIVVTDPATGAPIQLAVRAQKERVAEKVKNEREIWLQVSARLKSSSDPTTRRVGRVIGNIIEDAYASLQKGGRELDMKRERDLHNVAEKAYEQKIANPKTNLTVGVIAPFEEWQKKVVPEYQSRVLITPYVPNTKLENLPGALQGPVAEQIVDAELTALGERATDDHRNFDADGHFRNWLIALDRSKLVRIDYSQLSRISLNQSELMKGLVHVLMDGGPGASARLEKFFQEHDREIFMKPASQEQMAKAIRAVMSRNDFPPPPNFFDRLLFIQNELEAHFSESDVDFEFRHEIRDQLSSLFRLNLYRPWIGDPSLLQKLANFAGLSQWRAILGAAKGVLGAK